MNSDIYEKYEEAPETEDVMLETAPQFEKWRRRLFKMNCIIALGVFLLEVGVNIILIFQDKTARTLAYHMLRYLVIPSGLVFLAVLFDYIMLKRFPKKNWLLNYVMVMTVVFMCCVVSVTHYVFPITLTSFVIPVLMSVVFGNRQLTCVTTAACSFGVIITGLWRNFDGSDSDRYFVIPEVVLSLGILILSLIVARVVISLMDEQNRRLLDAIRKEKRSQKEADAANRAKSSFLANMSHEIRTPINAILGMNEMILREEKDPVIRGYAGTIQSSGNSLLAIVNDVLDISKIESGKLEIVPVEYEINSLISDCCNMVAGRARAKELELRVECSEDVPLKLFGDETHIRQVIVNLLTNAVKYTEKGSVRLSVGGAYDGELFRLRASVSDTGIGISEENLSQLFDQFQRFDLHRNRNIEGTGLGLAIVKRLCMLMSGTVTAESVRGEGSTFTVEIPQRVRDATHCGFSNINYSTSADYEYTHSFEAPDAHILAVDDLTVNLLVIVNMLKSTRINVDTAGSGRECLEKASTRKYDLILMDHMMPDMDGIATFKALRGDKSSPNRGTPVIMLTANALAGVREQYMGAGFADYISKPVRGAKLEEVIRRNLPPELVKPAGAEEPAEQSTLAEPAGNDGLCGLAEAVPELNLNIALSYCCDSPEFFGELLRDFAANDRTDELRSAFDEKRWEDYRRTAHSLKSTSLTVGLTGLSERARASEASLKNGCVDFAEVNHAPLLEEYSATLERIRKYLKDKSE